MYLYTVVNKSNRYRYIISILNYVKKNHSISQIIMMTNDEDNEKFISVKLYYYMVANNNYNILRINVKFHISILYFQNFFYKISV